MMQRLTWLLLVVLCCAQSSTALPVQVEDPGTQAYRNERYREAMQAWVQQIEELPSNVPHAELARLASNVGNAWFRAEDFMRATAWYTHALRFAPRSYSTFENLELARSSAGLEPADRGDLDDTLARLYHGLTRRESEWLLVGAGLALAGCLAWAFLGGRLLASLGVAASGFTLATALVLYVGASDRTTESLGYVIKKGGISLRSEPRSGATKLQTIRGGEALVLVDSLPGWVRVRFGSEGEGWLPEDSVLIPTLPESFQR